MRKNILFTAPLAVLALASIAITPECRGRIEKACAGEVEAHEFYVANIGPKRTAEQRAKEQRFFERAMKLCAIAAPSAEVAAARAEAAAARK